MVATGDCGIHLTFLSGNTSFQNPVTQKAVHVFADAPHMIKLLRNHFLDSGYLLNGKIINSKPIVDLLGHTQNPDLNIAHKLGLHLLTVKGKIESVLFL